MAIFFNKKYNIKSPIGINFHGYETFQSGQVLWLAQTANFKIPVLYSMNNANYVFSYGGKISEIISELGFRSKIIEIPTGIDKKWIKSSVRKKSSTLKLVFLGRAERRKGIQEINNVIGLIDKSLRIEFYFIGPIENKLKLADKRTNYLVKFQILKN